MDLTKTTQEVAPGAMPGWTRAIMDQPGQAPTRTTTLREALRASEERLDLVLRGSNDGFWDWDVATGELYLSSRWLEILGYEAEDLEPHIGTLEKVCHPDDVGDLHKALAVQLEGTTSQNMVVEHRARAKSGEWKWILTRGTVGKRDEGGRPLRVAGAATDITDRKHAEQELREHHDLLDEMVAQRTLELAQANAQLQSDIARREQAEEKLQETNRMLVEALERERRISAQLKAAIQQAEAASRAKSEFLANMSHELRTPMNGIMGMTELTLASELTDEQREYLTIAMESSKSLLSLLNDILDFSKIEAGKLEVETIEFDLVATLEGVVDLLGHDAVKKGLEFICYARPDTPVRLCGDPGRLRQVLVNLAGNAIKFTERGEVEICVRAEKRTDGAATLLFTVRDTGIGIPRERQEEIFDSFTQADGAMTRKYGGTGLGLAVSKQLVDLMGGEIWVESETGKGSTFSFRVTFPTSLEGDRQDSPIRQAGQYMRGKRILVVADNAACVRALGQMLETWGCATPSLSEAKGVLEMLKPAVSEALPFDLVLMDTEALEAGRLQLDRAIRGDDRLAELPVVLFGSPEYRKQWQEPQESATTAFLTKPIRQSVLRDTLVNIFSGGQAAALPSVRRRQAGDRRRYRARVLLVEDDPVNRKVAGGILEKANHDVTMADNGLAALEILQEKSFDLILMDVQMPELDGFEVTKRIRADERWREMPVVAMTAHAMKGDRERCLDAGMDDYLTKPVTAEVLLQMVDKWAAKSDSVPPDRDSAPPPAPSGVEQASSTKDPLDMAQALKRLGGDRALFADVLHAFLEDIPRLIDELQAAVAGADAAQLRIVAHTLKGAASNICAEGTRRVSQQLEQLGKSGELQQADSLLQELREHVGSLQGYAASLEGGLQE